jgi:hypothetical protein
MTKWEYYLYEVKVSGWTGKINIPEIDEELNRLGSEGWELVHSISPTAAGTASALTIILKRQK